MMHDLDFADITLPGNNWERYFPKETDKNFDFPSKTQICDDKCKSKKSAPPLLEKSDNDLTQKEAASVGSVNCQDSEYGSSYSSEEGNSGGTRGSWDLPAGPVAWDDRDLTFEQLLHYADLTLTEEEENGVLTDRIIAACASYLTRSPASKSLVVAKVSLDNKNLSDIRIIANHRFLQYVDLSWNNIKDLSSLGNLPYLMYLDVSHNMLEEVLRFEPPWNLTYVNYSYNEVWQVNDLSEFWSLSYLDLSHNKISKIQGLDTLRYLRYLNLSHNKITRFENLNNLRITDLNLECNLISTFEEGPDNGVKTMQSLCSLCLNNNLISDLGFLKGVHHLKKLELQGNRISKLLELNHMISLRKLRLLDMTGNPICNSKSYRNLLLSILPRLRFLDQTEVHPSEKVDTYLDPTCKIQMQAAQSSARMVLLDQLNDNALDLDVIPVDQASYPLVILVGPSSSGKKVLVSELGKKYEDKIFIGKLHTTRDVLEDEESVLIKIRREEFNEKVKNGNFYCIMENLGHFFGLSKEMLGMAVKAHKLCLTCMDLEGALTMHSYGIQCYLVLTLPSSEKEHGERLKKNYGPVITYLGAAYIAKRKMRDIRKSNVRRVKEIIYDIIEEVVFMVDERQNLCFASGGARIRSNLEKFNTGRSSPDFNSFQEHFSSTSDLHTPYMSTKDIPADKKFECPDKCNPFTCTLQETFKEYKEVNQDTNTDYSRTTTVFTNSKDELREEGSGTCSTSYSVEIPPSLRLDHISLDEEGNFGEEDDIFADWSSPFIDWDEVNIDPDALEEVAEELCQKFVSRVLATRDIYQNIHLDNPGLFSRVVQTDDREEALKNITEFLRDVWRSMPEKHKIFNVESDYAYQRMVPKRLEKLKGMIREERSSIGENCSCAESFAQIKSPRTIVSQMQSFGYDSTAEKKMNEGPQLEKMRAGLADEGSLIGPILRFFGTKH